MNKGNLHYVLREEEKYNNDENSLFDIKKIKIFDMKELKDKRLKIKSFSEGGYSIVVGFDKKSKDVFLLNEKKQSIYRHASYTPNPKSS